MNWISRRFEAMRLFFKQVKVEMHKVSWPSREQVVNDTVVVIVATAIVSLYIFGLDQIFKTVIFNWILRIGA